LIRVLLDEDLRIPADAKLVATAAEAPLIIFAGQKAEAAKLELLRSSGVEVVCDVANGRDLSTVLTELGFRSIQSILVEGGGTLAGKLLESGLVNKVSFFLAPIIIGGREAPSAIGGAGADLLANALRLQDVEIVRRGEDIEITGYPGKDEG
jgi:diaminohydroxyphosphoribosylaminopyrimidine deaminase/5-amino-6-(5-phosphoribosylamino)uracil reductase